MQLLRGTTKHQELLSRKNFHCLHFIMSLSTKIQKLIHVGLYARILTTNKRFVFTYYFVESNNA